MPEVRRVQSDIQKTKREVTLTEALPLRFFKALGDRSRVTILAKLAVAGKPMTVTQIAALCPLDISVVSRHLAYLRDVGILKSSRQGKVVYYSVYRESFAEILRSAADAVESCCAAAENQNGS